MKRLLQSAKVIVPALLAAAVFLLFIFSPLDEVSFTTATDVVPAAFTVVVDAGHGGEDGGAVSLTGMHESGLNLDIAEKLELIFAFYSVPTVMTRTSEMLEYSEKANTIREKKVEDQKRRLALINALDQPLLISIHQNNYPSAGPFGAQVFYAPTNGSKELSETMQQLLVDSINPQNRRTAVMIPSSIMLMNNVSCPAVLVECGFLSNPEEERLLRTESYRLKLAAVIAAGYIYSQESLTELIYGGLNESENSVLLYGLRE